MSDSDSGYTLRNLMVSCAIMACAFVFMKGQDYLQSKRALPDVMLYDEAGRATSLNQVRGLIDPLVVVYLPDRTSNCPGVEQLKKTSLELAAQVGDRAKVIGIAENANADQVRAVKNELGIPFEVYTVDGMADESRPLMLALASESSMVSRANAAGANIVINTSGKVVHREPNPSSAATLAFLSKAEKGKKP